MGLSPELVVQMLGMFAFACAMYGAIRSDLKSLHMRVEAAEANIETARERMDNHIDRSNRP